MGVPKRLTEMQQRFAELLVFGGPEGPMTQTEAAVAAGYSPKRARQEGSELCNPKLSPLVVKYIGQLKEERLQLRVRELEDINEGHRQLNAELRKEMHGLQEKASELEKTKNLLQGYKSVIQDLSDKLRQKES